jgi:PAP2 superfamily protein
VTRTFDAIGRRLPHGWRDLILQLGLFFFAYEGYQLVRGLVDGKTALAYANAGHVVDLERSLGTFFEPGLQQSLLGHAWLIDGANWMYINSHFVVTTTFLAWLYLFRNRHFAFVRNMFLVAMGLALVGYVLFPTAPPRLLPGDGFTDTIAAFTNLAADGHAASLLINKYAAVPSMHCGFALMVAGTMITIVRNPIGRVLWALYPLVIFGVVVVTGNHFWFDGFVGALVAGVSALVAHRLLARFRPEEWSFRRRDVEAPA